MLNSMCRSRWSLQNLDRLSKTRENHRSSRGRESYDALISVFSGSRNRGLENYAQDLSFLRYRNLDVLR